jgi:hypothetical protein
VSDNSWERIARQREVRRAINEAIRRGNGHRADGARPFLCECGVLGCNELVELSPPEYAGLCSRPQHYVVCTGHDGDLAARVVDRVASGALVVAATP